MDLPSYRIVERANDLSEFVFVSSGPNGMIPKVILFEEIPEGHLYFEENLYNIALLDILDGGKLSDTNRSNNNDLSKILATTVQVLMGYTSVFPERTIFIQGSDNEGQRTSLYHRAIKNNFVIFEKEFDIVGITDIGKKEKFNPFKKYIAFLVRRK